MKVTFTIDKNFRKFKQDQNHELEIPENGILYLAGNNGCGKSTLLQILRSKMGHQYVYVGSRKRLVPCDNKYVDVLYFVRLGDCIDYDEHDQFEGISHISYDTYFNEWHWWDELVERIPK